VIILVVLFGAVGFYSQYTKTPKVRETDKASTTSIESKEAEGDESRRNNETRRLLLETKKMDLEGALVKADHEKNVDVGSSPADRTTTTSSSSTPSTLQPTYSTSSSKTATQPDNKDEEDDEQSVFRSIDGQDCSGTYFYTIKGNDVRLQCPEGLLWNPQLETCAICTEVIDRNGTKCCHKKAHDD
jgi:hypothetical protein